MVFDWSFMTFLFQNKMKPNVFIIALLFIGLCLTHPASNELLSRQKRTIPMPVTFGRVSLIGARLQIFPFTPIGATNQVLFDVDVTIPRWLAPLIPGQP